MSVATLENKVACASIFIFEVIMLIVYGLCVKYTTDVPSLPQISNPLDFVSSAPPIAETVQSGIGLMDGYPMFQDVHVMIFIGFGYLMTFLKKYAHGALGFSFLVSCLVIQWDIIMEGLFKEKTIHVSLTSLIDADIAAAAVLISFGAVLGKTSPLQLLYMGLFETSIFAANKYVVEQKLKVFDAGGSMIVHQFGAYFGLAVSFIMSIRDKSDGDKSPLEASTYESDTLSMLGTLFLWVYWPSFNGALVSGDQKYKAVVNTYLSLTASTMITFATTVCLNKNWKFEMFHVQNATLAGGVAIGAACTMNIHPVGALVVGGCAGFLSTIGFRYIKDFFQKTLRIHDTCGVHYLHGIPGLIGGIVSGIVVMCQSKKNTYYSVFQDILQVAGQRTDVVQGGYQFAGLAVTLLMAVGGGMLTGVIVGIAIPNITKDESYNDEVWWDDENGEGA